MSRIVVPLHGFVGWNGGIDLMRMLLSGLKSVPKPSEIEIHILSPEAPAFASLGARALRAWRTFRSGASSASSDGGTQVKLMQAAIDMSAGYPMTLCGPSPKEISCAASRIGGQVIFPTFSPIKDPTLARVGYIFDFQHLHLPHLFTARARRRRDANFKAIAEHSDRIVVNSRYVAADVERCLGVTRDRIWTLPFTPYALPEWFETSPADTATAYSISAKYFMVSNHFWKHKDHATVLRAFAHLAARQADLQLVLTGDPVDYRDPTHFRRLLDLAEDLRISEKIRVLGLIPKMHQLALMRGAISVVQPSLFEGGPGGGATYDAIGLGTPVIAADIPPCREIEYDQITYFEPGNADELALRMREAVNSVRQKPSRQHLLRIGAARLERLGTYLELKLSHGLR